MACDMETQIMHNSNSLIKMMIVATWVLLMEEVRWLFFFFFFLLSSSHECMTLCSKNIQLTVQYKLQLYCQVKMLLHKEQQYNTNYNTNLLPRARVIAQGMFHGAKYSHLHIHKMRTITKINISTNWGQKSSIIIKIYSCTYQALKKKG